MSVSRDSVLSKYWGAVHLVNGFMWKDLKGSAVALKNGEIDCGVCGMRATRAASRHTSMYCDGD